MVINLSLSTILFFRWESIMTEVFLNKEQFDTIYSLLTSFNSPIIIWLNLLSTAILLATAFFSLKSARASEKSAKFLVMPAAYFILRSAKTLCKRQNIDFDKLTHNEKLFTRFIVANNSKFPILFYVHITLKTKDGTEIYQKA